MNDFFVQKFSKLLIYSRNVLSANKIFYFCWLELIFKLMKRTTLLTVVCILMMQSGFAGGILTNANQSAQYVRMLSRNASFDIDAVYFNPAGLVKLENGFHFAFNNQSIFQSRTIENRFPLLNQSNYKGDLAVPFFPTVFAVYKKDKLALSFGLGVNSGGGTAEYKTGLPSFEIPFSQLPASLNQLGVPTQAYSTDLYFKGKSVFWGYQFNASYEFSDVVSGAVGFRLLNAKNTYDGHIKNISVITNGQSILAKELLLGISAQAAAASQVLAEYPSDAVMPDETASQYGFPSGTTFGVASATMSAKAGIASENGNKLGDKYEKLDQTGFGITPIIGLNISPNDRLNMGFRYEFKTALKMTNKTEVDDLEVYPDGEEFRNDIPAIFTAGVDYKLYDNFRLSGSFSNYFDKDANWSGKESDVEKNYYELAFGMEYQVSDATAISAGVMHSETGVGRGYQTDISYSLSSNTVGFGMQFQINESFDLDLGGLFTMYEEGYKEIQYEGIGTFKELYDKSNLVFSIGLTYHLFN